MDYYVTIVGEINVCDFQYMVLSHHKEVPSYYSLAIRGSFQDYKRIGREDGLIIISN